MDVKMCYTSALTQFAPSNGLLERTHVPDGIFTLCLSVESRGDQCVGIQPSMFLGFGSIMRHDLHGILIFSTNIEDSQFSTFGRDGVKSTFRIPPEAGRHCWNLAKTEGGLLVLRIPDANCVILRH